MRLAQIQLGILLFVFGIGAAFTNVYGQGVIIPRPCERCPVPRRPVVLPRSLPVKSIQISAKISAQVATTHVEQIFRNDTDFVLEGTYFFPIPETASISEFAIWDGDRRLVGEVRGKEEARRIYDEIVRRQRDPGLLEYAGKDLFQASIFPIPAHADKKLEITYTQVLKAEAGTVAYRYPLGTGKNLVSIGQVSGRIEVEGREALRNLYSPSHQIDTSRRGETRATVSFEANGTTNQQDFQLFYTVSNDDFGLTLLTHREPGKDGYFLLLLSPKEQVSEQEFTAKDIVFVVDTSGSMAEEGKMEKARAALSFGVKTLRETDSFNIVSFAGEDHLMQSGMIKADAAGRARGEDFIRQLRPTGGTNINDALLSSLKQFIQTERPKMVVFLTDGLPTVGESNIDRIVDNVRKARVPGVRLFTFGVGYDVNTSLLDKLAAENGGVAEYVEPKEDIEQKVSSFFAKISFPVLTDITLDMGGVETDLIYPRNLPDVFRGSQLALIGRYKNPVDLEAVRLKLAGRSGNSVRTVFYDGLKFPVNDTRNDFLPRLWATRRVGWLLEQIRTNGEQQELKDEVTDLGTRYGIVTPYTSYLALESGARNQFMVDGAADIRQAQPSPVMRRDSAAKSARPSATSADSNMGYLAGSGAAAVQRSKRERVLQESVRSEDEKDAIGSIKRAGGKTFYLTDGTWTDSEITANSRLPETVVVFGTDEYFALLKQKPALGQFFSIAEKVVVMFEGRIYRVKAASGNAPNN